MDEQQFQASRTEIDLLKIVRDVWAERKLLLRVVIGFAIFGIVFSLLQPLKYKSTVTLFSNSQSGTSSLGGFQSVALSMGIDLGGNDQMLPLTDVLRSRRIKREAVYAKYKTKKFDEPVNLITYWGLDDTTSFKLKKLLPQNLIRSLLTRSKPSPKELAYEREMEAIKRLGEHINVRENELKSTLSVVDVYMPEPELSAEVANQLYRSAVDVYTSISSAMAREKREFIENRLKDAEAELRQAEQNLKDFRESNIAITSPNLMLEHERYMREVEIQKQIYITLRKELETTSIEEQKENASAQLLDSAVKPTERFSPQRKKIVIIFTFLGFFAGVLFILFRPRVLEIYAQLKG